MDTVNTDTHTRMTTQVNERKWPQDHGDMN